MATSTKFGIVAAMERELRPFLRRCDRMRSSREFVLYERPDAVVICGGIGARAAGRAAQVLVDVYRPTTLISIGFAGAVKQGLKVADLLLPAEILDVETGRSFCTQAGAGRLATITRVANESEKAKLRESGVHAVDMEAAAVAQVAQQNRLRFLALKAISDAADFALPSMDRFISETGKFRMASFLTHVALRPAIWPRVRRLAADSARAAAVLSEALDTLLREGNIGETQIGAIVGADA